MNFQFSHPGWLILGIPALAFTIWLSFHSFSPIAPWRRRSSLLLRSIILILVVLALAGLEWLTTHEGMNIYFVLDRSESIPFTQQEGARAYVNAMALKKKEVDKAGAVVFGAQPSIESSLEANEEGKLKLDRVQSLLDTTRSDLAGAIRLATAAFPETGQKRLVLLTDANENIGDSLAAVISAKPLGVSVDVVPLGSKSRGDVIFQKLTTPSKVKKGAPFDVKMFLQSDTAREATIRIYRNEEHKGDEKVQLKAGKNLFSFNQTLDESGFYHYTAKLDAPGDAVLQNNQATAFVNVSGEPRILFLSSSPDLDQPLVEALQSAKLDVLLADATGFPETLPEIQSYDCILFSNIAAGEISRTQQQLLEAAVRDYGVGFVCIGGDQAFAAGGYRGTPFENLLPVSMELDSKKVLPAGALVLVMHGMEFAGGNEVARQVALGTLDALGPRDELGVLLWNGLVQWHIPLDKAGDKRAMAKKIAGMNQGDLGDFQEIMNTGYQALKKSKSHLKHMIVFSDGDPAPPRDALLEAMRADKITASSVLIAGHAGPVTMMGIAEKGGGRFYNITSPADLPQIFIKESAVILKSAIYEEPFQPQRAFNTELTAGLSSADLPELKGYVGTTAKPRAETPLLTDKGDPLLAHWQFGLGRSVAFTSDARAKWAVEWLSWPQYRMFWVQAVQWSVRRVENADFNTEVTVENGVGHIVTEAVDTEGKFRNFLKLETIVTSPKGKSKTVPLEQVSPGRYEAKFDVVDSGLYTMNLMDLTLAGTSTNPPPSQRLGTTVDFSPEFASTEPNSHLLSRLAEMGNGKILDLQDLETNSFERDRKKTFHPRPLWSLLLQWAIFLFPIDVGIRRVHLDREEWVKFFARAKAKLFFWRGQTRPEQDQAMAALLRRKGEVKQMKLTKESALPAERLFQAERPEDTAIATDKVRVAGATLPTPPISNPPAAPSAQPPSSTAGRLLEAKKKARR